MWFESTDYTCHIYCITILLHLFYHYNYYCYYTIVTLFIVIHISKKCHCHLKVFCHEMIKFKGNGIVFSFVFSFSSYLFLKMEQILKWWWTIRSKMITTMNWAMKTVRRHKKNSILQKNVWNTFDTHQYQNWNFISNRIKPIAS